MITDIFVPVCTRIVNPIDDGKPRSVVRITDPASCTHCGTCIARCIFKAAALDNQLAIDAKRCLGRGVCIAGCPVHIRRLEKGEKLNPPDPP